MGITKRLLDDNFEEELNESLAQWVYGRFEIENFDEGHPEWENYKDQYFEELKFEQDESDEDWWGDFHEQWRSVDGKTPHELFTISMMESRDLLDSSHLDEPPHHVLSMLYGHVVASIEGYLYATFRELVLNDDGLSLSFVKNDDSFSNKTVSYKVLFFKYKEDPLRKLIDEYLQNFLFHKIKKVSSMYKKVLGVDFGEVKWLYDAVAMRHDCVHRAGFDREGNKVKLDKSVITELIDQSSVFIDLVDKLVLPHRPTPPENEF